MRRLGTLRILRPFVAGLVARQNLSGQQFRIDGLVQEIPQNEKTPFIEISYGGEIVRVLDHCQLQEAMACLRPTYNCSITRARYAGNIWTEKLQGVRRLPGLEGKYLWETECHGLGSCQGLCGGHVLICSSLNLKTSSLHWETTSVREFANGFAAAGSRFLSVSGQQEVDMLNPCERGCEVKAAIRLKSMPITTVYGLICSSRATKADKNWAGSHATHCLIS